MQLHFRTLENAQLRTLSREREEFHEERHVGACWPAGNAWVSPRYWLLQQYGV